MSDPAHKSRDSIGCGTVALFATLLLVILKLAHAPGFDWPWLAVFAPVLAYAGLVLSVIIGAVSCVAALLLAVAALFGVALILDAVTGRKGKT